MMMLIRQYIKSLLVLFIESAYAFVFFLEMQIDAENAIQKNISVHEKLNNCWDDRVCGVVSNKIMQSYVNCSF